MILSCLVLLAHLQCAYAIANPRSTQTYYGTTR